MTLRVDRERAERIADSLWYRHIDNTVIAVVQDNETGEVLMVAHMSREAVIRTLTTGLLHLWSTTRRRLWMKGESSGNVMHVVDFIVDCDGDAVLVKVRPTGPACHLGTRSCFSRRIEL